MPMVLTSDTKFLYVALRSPPFPVSSFSIDSATGSLTFLALAPLHYEMCHLSTDRSGRYLFASSYVSSKLTVNRIAQSGQIQAPAIQVVDTPPKAHCFLLDPTNRWGFSTSLGGDLILQHKFDVSTGTLSANSPAFVRTKSASGPRHMALHPQNQFLYVLNELDATIGCFAVDATTGTIEERQSICMLAGDEHPSPSAADIHITPEGRYLYASERSTNVIVAFLIDVSGKLTRIASFPTEPTPRAFSISPCGDFLLVTGEISNCISVYAISADNGNLTRVAREPAGSIPNWIEFVREQNN
jgi:6-phosphogluconolactonase